MIVSKVGRKEKKVRTIAFLLSVFAALVNPVSAQPIIKGAFAEPIGAELDKFPLKTKRLSAKEETELGLSLRLLYKPTVVQNHFRNIRPDDRGRFALEVLPPATPVLVDRSGKLRYKADCGNRIVEVESYPPLSKGGLEGVHYPQEPHSGTESREGKPKNTLGGKETSKKGFFQSIIDNTKEAAAGVWNFLWDFLRWLFWALVYFLGVGLIVAILCGLYWLVRDTINQWNRGGQSPPPTTNPPATSQQATPVPDSETQKASVATPVATPRPDSSESTGTLRAVPARGSFGPAREGSTEKPKAASRRLRVEISEDGDVYTKSKGYTSFLVEQDEEGNTVVRTNSN